MKRPNYDKTLARLRVVDEDEDPPPAPTPTVRLRPVTGQMIKPGEMMDLHGIEGLTLQDRRIYNQLIENAFGPEMMKEDHEWSIAISELRGSHKGNERISETVNRLMKTVCTARLPNGKTRRFQLLGGNDMDDEDRPNGRLSYSFDKRLIELLQDSVTFGKLQIAVMHAFTSKYALALYEFGAKRVHLRYKNSEEFTLEDFRAILGVPKGKLERYNSLKERAIEPALREVNALAEFWLTVTPRKTSRRVTHVVIEWARKNALDRDEAMQELGRPRVGRTARIRGEAEELAALA